MIAALLFASLVAASEPLPSDQAAGFAQGKADAGGGTDMACMLGTCCFPPAGLIAAFAFEGEGPPMDKTLLMSASKSPAYLDGYTSGWKAARTRARRKTAVSTVVGVACAVTVYVLLANSRSKI